MTAQTHISRKNEAAQKQRATRPVSQGLVALTPAAELTILQRIIADPAAALPADILPLQRTVGNRAVTRLIQAKLMVGPAGDRYEQEADRVAEQVMSMQLPSPGRRGAGGEVQRQAPEEEEEVQAKPSPHGNRGLPLAASITPLLHRQAEEEEEELQTKPLLQRQAPEEEEEVQTKLLVQRQAPEEEELQTKLLVQRQAEEEEEVQTKPLVQRQAEEEEELQAKPLVQRQAEEEEEVQMEPLVQRQAEEEEEEIQTKPLLQRRGEGGFEAGSDLEQRLAASRGGGNPLPAETREFMEPRFGADFSGVRVHTGGEAVQMSKELEAQAFTHGQDVYMGAGKYDPGSDAGKRLLAHELTHVVQQNGNALHRDVDEKSAPSITPLVQRQAEEEEELQTKPLVQRQAEEEEEIQTKPLAASVTPGRGLDVVQRVPLYPGSEIDYDAVAGTMGFGEVISRTITPADLGTLQAAINTMQLHHVDQHSIEKQLKAFWKSPHNRIGTDLMVKMWNQKAGHIATVDARRLANRAQLELQGLLNVGDVFEEYELTGADPHKHGEATLFERYHTPGGQIKRLVYKPVDLSPEQMLYQGAAFHIAQFGGTYAAPTAGVAGVHGYYPYLEEEGPRDAQDVQGIYRSLGEAAAVAYVYGLRDLHKENYIMLRNRIQWIDLEAMTGTFQTYQSAEMSTEFFTLLMQKLLNPLVRATEPGPDQWFKDWRRRHNRRPLIQALRALNVEQEIRVGFNLKKVQIPAGHPAQAAGLMTRFVPFPTEQLYDLVTAWHNRADLDAVPFPPAAWGGHPPAWYTEKLDAIKAWYHGPHAEVDTMFEAQATRAAIRRGDIPLFLRQGDSICDEGGNVLIAHSTHERMQLGAGAATLQADIDARRTGPAPAALTWLLNQALTQHAMMIAALEQNLPPQE